MNEVTILSPEKLDLIYGDVESQRVQEVVRELKSLHTDLRNSKGEEVHELVNDLNRSRVMLERDHDELIDSIQNFEDIDPLSRLNESGDKDDLIEFTRHLHNYLSMCHSLSEHGYRIRNKLDGDEIEEEYSRKLQEIGLATSGSFISDFRDYVQHRRVPIVTGNVKSDGKSEILLKKDELEEWDSWSSNGKSHLGQLDSEFGIRDEIKQYQDINKDFYDWFTGYIADQYDEEVNERNDIIDEMIGIQDELVPELNN